jgi:hypothetical protein
MKEMMKKLKLERILPAILAFALFFGTGFKTDVKSQPIGERIGQQQHETSVKSERPKTTGEFIDEARQDIPLNERMSNITRDSAEAFGQFGEGIGNSVKETAREIGKNVSGK